MRHWRSRACAPRKLVPSLALALSLVPVAMYGEIAVVACPAEIERAASTLATIFRQWPLRSSGDPIDESLQTITSELAERAREQSHRRWRTHVIRDSKLNAFSIGDGHIFVTEGMLRFVSSEAELAALLAHEFAHHMAGHFCNAQRKKGFVRNLFGRDRSKKENRQVGELSALVDPTRESEADRISIVMLERGGYDARATVLLAARMLATGSTSAHSQDEERTEQYGERIKALQKLLADKPHGNWRAGNSTAYTNMQELLKKELSP